MTINGRKVLGKFLFGSHTYGLEHKDSDKDYKVLVVPSFSELYYSARRSEKIKIGLRETIDGVDYVPLNIMNLSTQLAVGSSQWLEVLWSKEFEVCEELAPLWTFLVTNRDDIAELNLKGFWRNHMKAIKTDIKLYEAEKGIHHLHHALRNLYTLEDYTLCGDYGEAITYEKEDCFGYDMLMSTKISDGKYSEQEVYGHVKDLMDEIGKHYAFYDKEYTGKHHEYIKEEIEKIVRATIV